MSIQTKFVIQVGTGASAAISVVDTNDIRISYAVALTGSATYTIQHSLDGIVFFDNSDNTGQTTAQDGNYIFPVRSIRVNITAGAGTATLHVRQLVN